MHASLRPLFFLSPLLMLTLSGCSNDGAAYRIDGSQSAISIERRQDYFWEKRFQYSVIVSRLPDCQRKHAIQKAGPNARVELWYPGEGTYFLRIGENTYLTETQTCEGFQKLTEDPPGGYGKHLGTFGMKQGRFSFTPAPPEPETQTPAENPPGDQTPGTGGTGNPGNAR